DCGRPGTLAGRPVARRPGRGRLATARRAARRAGGLDPRLSGPRRGGSSGPGDVAATARPGPMESRGDRPRDVDFRAARLGGAGETRRGLHRGDTPRWT